MYLRNTFRLKFKELYDFRSLVQLCTYSRTGVVRQSEHNRGL